MSYVALKTKVPQQLQLTTTVSALSIISNTRKGKLKLIRRKKFERESNGRGISTLPAECDASRREQRGCVVFPSEPHEYHETAHAKKYIIGFRSEAPQ